MAFLFFCIRKEKAIGNIPDGLFDYTVLCVMYIYTFSYCNFRQVSEKLEICQVLYQLSLPRRVSTPQRRNKAKFCFLRRHARRRKHFSGCKRASIASALQQAASFCRKRRCLFRQERCFTNRHLSPKPGRKACFWAASTPRRPAWRRSSGRDPRRAAAPPVPKRLPG